MIALATLATGTARADVRTEARRHFRAGMEAIQRGRLDEGVAELELAYERLPHPNVLYNIGRAYAEAGRYEPALEYFERYLATDPPDRSEVEAFVAAIAARLAPAQPEGEAPTPVAEAPVAATVSREEQLALLESATQIEALAEATGSDQLRERARILREMAASLQAAEERGEAGAERPGAGGPAASAGQGEGEPPPVEIELAAAQEDLYGETVVAASRFAQDPLDAPNATYNITRQDIRLTGLPNVGELIRRSPGAHVLATGPSDLQIGIRGFNQRLSPRVLMLVNGRSVYVDPLGVNLYWSQPFGMDEVERIEVIRGPASALYGADAFSGIINVITRRPGDEPGTRVLVGVGNHAQLRAQATYSGRSGPVGYRLSAGYDHIDRYTTQFPIDSVDRESPFGDYGRGFVLRRALGTVEYRPRPGLSVDVEAGVMNAAGILSAQSLGDMYTSGPITHAMATLNSEWGYLRSYWNYVDSDGGTDTGLRTQFRWHTIDAEGAFSRAFELGWEHNVTAGAAYRKKIIDWDFLGPGTRDENHYAGFFQDTMRFGERVIFVASLRLDSHPLLENLQISPRGALVLRPTESTAIRLSAGRAFRTQTFLESYLDLLFPTPIAGVNAHGYGSELNEDLFGAPNLRPEQIVSTEIGFRFVGADYFDVDVAAYYNRVTNLVRLDRIEPFTLGQVGAGAGGYDPETAAFAAGSITFSNERNEFDVVGGEVSVRLYPVNGLDVYTNYSYNHAFVTGPEHRPSESVGPRHLANLGVQYRSPFGLDLSSDLHVVGAQIWQEQMADPVEGIVDRDLSLGAYYFVNARVGYRLFDDALDLGIVAQNVTNNRHYEQPLGQRIPLRILGTAAYRF